MRLSRARGILALMVLAALMPAAAWGSLFEPVSDRDLVCQSSAVIRGEVIQIDANWEGDPEAIWTRAVIRVDRSIRGSFLPGQYIEVKEIGGTVGSYTLVAQQFPTFEVGQEIVAMIGAWDDGSGELRVHGYGRGLFSVARQGGGRQAVATRYDVIESRRPVMHIDRIPPVVGAEDLEREVRGLASRCGARGGAR